uniref:Tetratricopeptide repeat protein 8 n=1 Tax=Clastoptera arizonana TaxID=38151 RepID=A0A1B6C7L1_9HEMI
MDPFYEVLYLMRNKHFEKCVKKCSDLLENNPRDQAIWALKMRALTAQIMVDDIESEEEGIAEALLDSDTIAQAARPGTSLKATDRLTSGQGLRPRTECGRPISGVVRPGTQTDRGATIEQILKTPRTTHSARPMTSQSARAIRLGTASMMNQPDAPFIQVTRLNLAKYAADQRLAKPLFQFIFYHENNVRHVSIFTKSSN